MKYYSTVQQLGFSWDQVITKFWDRYPNPYSSHVLSEDTLSRYVKDELLHTKRLITKTSKAPSWAQHFYNGPKFVCIVEESVLDPIKKVLTTYTRNVGYSKVMLIEERCMYKEDGPDSVQVERQAWVSSQVFGFSYALQEMGISRFKANAGRTLKGFEHVLHTFYSPEKLQELNTLATRADKLKTSAIKAKDIAKEHAVPVMEKAREKAAPVMEKAREKAAPLCEKSKEKAAAVMVKAREKSAPVVEKAKEKAACVRAERKEKTQHAMPFFTEIEF